MNSAPIPSPSPRARALAGLTGLTAIAALVLQYALLLQTVGATAGTGQALLRLLGYFTILSNIGVAAVCLARLRGRRDGMAAPAASAAVALYIGITGLVYVLVLRGLWHPQGAQWWADTGLHRDQQHLLPGAEAGHLRAMARADAAGLPLLCEGTAHHHPDP